MRTWGIHSSGLYPSFWKNAIDLDDDILRVRAGRHEPGEGRAGDRRRMGEDEIVRELDFERPPVSGRLAVAIFPSGSPVLKKKGVCAAIAAVGSNPITATEIANRA